MSEVLYDVEGPVAWLTMSNPSKANARDAQMRAQLHDAFVRAESDPGVRAVVLTGAGDRVFCAGGDIDAFPTTFEDGMPLVRAAFDGFAQPQRLLKPVIAAVNGAAIGGGTELTLGCDYVVAAEHAEFALPEVELGIIPPFGIVRLCARVGELAAIDLLLSGRRVGAAEAATLGLVGDVVAANDLRQRCQEIGEQLATKSAPALAAVKTVLAARELQLAHVATPLTAAMFSTADAQARIASFRSARTRAEAAAR
jgi:enoyl-CoA hydratase/carnithine racemase